MFSAQTFTEKKCKAFTVIYIILPSVLIIFSKLLKLCRQNFKS